MKLTTAQLTLLRRIQSGDVTAATVRGGLFDHWALDGRKVTAAVYKLIDAGLVNKPATSIQNWRTVRPATLTEAGIATLS